MVIKGKEYSLKYSNRALFNIEKKLNSPIFKIISDSEKLSSLEVISVFLWAGIGSEELTVDDVLDGLDFNKLEDYIKEMTSAINEAFNTGEKKK